MMVMHLSLVWTYTTTIYTASNLFPGTVINAGVAGCCTGVAMSFPGICILLGFCFMVFGSLGYV